MLLYLVNHAAMALHANGVAATLCSSKAAETEREARFSLFFGHPVMGSLP